MIELSEHQLEAISKMKNGCILCGDTGSGKSRTALGYYFKENNGCLIGEYIPMNDPPLDLYIVTTARKRDELDWVKEMAPFLLSPDKDVSLYSNKVVIDSWNNIEKYKDVKDSFFIFDEQRVVGYGKWSKSFIKISKNNKWILLSATPGDTWSDYIPVFIANGFYRNKTEFANEHIIYSRFVNYPLVDRYVGIKKLAKMRDSILIDLDDNRKTTKHFYDIFHTYDAVEYKRILKYRWNPWEKAPIDRAGSLCYALRRLVNSSSDKQIKLLELLEKHPKAIIFYNFDYELDILRDLPYGMGVSIAEWNGHKHEEIPKTDKWVYLVQYTAGAEGWNCIETDTVIFFSQHYSYKIMHQACGRIDRLNTPFIDLNYYYLKTKSPIDTAIARSIEKKKIFNAGNYTKRL